MPTLAVTDRFSHGSINTGLALLKTSDGKAMADLWNEVIAPSLDAYNAVTNELAQFMGHFSPALSDTATQIVARRWQKKTEIVRAANMHQTYNWTVRSARESFIQSLSFTVPFIESASSEKIVELFNATMKALVDQKFAAILGAFYTSTESAITDPHTGEALKVWTLVNGTGTMPIPTRGINTFSTSHSHFDFVDSTSGTWTTLTNREAKIRSLIKLVTEHGYESNLIVLAGGSTIDDVIACPGFRTLRDFSPMVSSNPAALAGQDPQASILVRKKLGGVFVVEGTLLNATVVSSEMLPTGYVAVFDYQGQDSENNPVHWFEGPVKTRTNSPFPYVETMLEAEFGAGVRKRLNGACLYVAASASAYVDPTVVGAAQATGDTSIT